MAGCDTCRYYDATMCTNPASEFYLAYMDTAEACDSWEVYREGKGEFRSKIDITDYQRITLLEMSDRGAENLVRAIVRQAAKDYITIRAVSTLKTSWIGSIRSTGIFAGMACMPGIFP